MKRIKKTVGAKKSGWKDEGTKVKDKVKFSD